MKKAALAAAALGAVTITALGAAVVGSGPSAGTASSHREAPLIAEDPSADNTDLYAFRSPDKPNTVTIVSNWIPGEDPAAGPNYYTFSPSAKYKINIDRTGDARPDIVYEFRFGRTAGPGVPRQHRSRAGRCGGTRSCSPAGKTPPNNIGPRSTPNYPSLVSKSIVQKDGLSIFAGQRDDAFFGDIGAIFDLLAFRKGTGANGGGKDFFAGYAVHSIALQIPIAELNATQLDDRRLGVDRAAERDRGRQAPARLDAGVAARQPARQRGRRPDGRQGPVEPLDAGERQAVRRPGGDADPREADERPLQGERAGRRTATTSSPCSAPASRASTTPATPSPTCCGSTTRSRSRRRARVNRLGVIGGDNGGFPNGRRLGDDVVDAAERVMAGFLKGNKVELGDGVNSGDVPNLASFPYEAAPQSGFANSKGEPRP